MSAQESSMVVDARIEYLDEVLELVHTVLDGFDCPLKVQLTMDMAVEELFVNVCHYAYGDGEGPCRIDCRCEGDPPALTVRLTDEGIPFDPLAKDDPTAPTSISDAKVGGLGIFMVKQSVDQFTYRREDGKNIVTIVKQL